MVTGRITQSTNKKLHALLNKYKQMEFKADLVNGFTQGRTASSFFLQEQEAQNMIRFLNKQFGATPGDKMRKKILAICHTMGWYLRNADDSLVMHNGKPQLDYGRINAFCTEKGPFKKNLQLHKTKELTILVTVFEKLLNSN